MSNTTLIQDAPESKPHLVKVTAFRSTPQHPFAANICNLVWRGIVIHEIEVRPAKGDRITLFLPTTITRRPSDGVKTQIPSIWWETPQDRNEFETHARLALKPYLEAAKSQEVAK